MAAPVDHHGPQLAEAVRSRLCLQVVLRGTPLTYQHRLTALRKYHNTHLYV